MPRASHRQLLAISDSPSFFVPEWKEPKLLQKMLELTGKECPRIAHFGAANGDSAEKQAKFYALAQRARCIPRVFSLFALEDDDPDSFFTGVDAIYIDGGNTRNLVALMREWGAHDALHAAYQRGVVIAGASAGANVMFNWGTTDSVRTRIDPMPGIGLLPGAVCVHYDIREDRRCAFDRLMTSVGKDLPAYKLNDGEVLHFRDEELIDRIRY